MRWGILAALMALPACEFEREGQQALPQVFVGSEAKLLAMDMVEMYVSVSRPRPGAMQAYSDCVAAQYALIRGLNYARRVASFPVDRAGLADIVTERTTYLLSDIAPSGASLNAAEIVADCREAGIPTV